MPIGIVMTALVRKEPNYQGKTAREWFFDIRNFGGTNQAVQVSHDVDALRHMVDNAVPMLQAALKDASGFQREKAAWVLGELGPVASNAVPDLIMAVGDKDIAVQNYSINALKAIGTTTETVVPQLIAKVDGDNPGTGFFAAELLDKIEQNRKGRILPPISGDGYEYAMHFARASLPSIRVSRARAGGNGPVSVLTIDTVWFLE